MHQDTRWRIDAVIPGTLRDYKGAGEGILPELLYRLPWQSWKVMSCTWDNQLLSRTCRTWAHSALSSPPVAFSLQRIDGASSKESEGHTEKSCRGWLKMKRREEDEGDYMTPPASLLPYPTGHRMSRWCMISSTFLCTMPQIDRSMSVAVTLLLEY